MTDKDTLATAVTHGTTGAEQGLTLDEKMDKYRDGKYVMYSAPPVCTRYWVTRDWLLYVDHNGRWL